jgi:hypothetical protein
MWPGSGQVSGLETGRYRRAVYSGRSGTLIADLETRGTIMNIGYCSLRFYLHGNNSLKGKRKVIRSIKDRLKNKFNVSVAEVGDQDVWQNIHLGIAAVNSDAQYLDGLFKHVVNFVDNMHLAEMTDCQTEIINVNNSYAD